MDILRLYDLGTNLQRLLHRFWGDKLVVTKAGRFYGRLCGTERGVTQGGYIIPNYFQHCGGHIGKGGASVSLWSTGGSEWVGVGGRKSQHIFLCS